MNQLEFSLAYEKQMVSTIIFHLEGTRNAVPLVLNTSARLMHKIAQNFFESLLNIANLNQI